MGRMFIKLMLTIKLRFLNLSVCFFLMEMLTWF